MVVETAYSRLATCWSSSSTPGGKSQEAKWSPCLSVSSFTPGSTRNAICSADVPDSASSFIRNAASLALVLLVPSADLKLVVVLPAISHKEDSGTLCCQRIRLGVLHCSWWFAMQMEGFISRSAISMVTKWRQVCITSLVKCNPSPGTCAKEADGDKGTAVYFLEMEATKATFFFFLPPPPSQLCFSYHCPYSSALSFPSCLFLGFPLLKTGIVLISAFLLPRG